jgi:hypothetical protein
MGLHGLLQGQLYSVSFYRLGSSACSHSKLINSENWKLYKFSRAPWTSDQPTYPRKHKHRINADRHQCLDWYTNPRSQCLRGRKHFMPYTTRPVWSVIIYYTWNVSLCFESRLFQEFWICFISRSNLVRNVKQALRTINLKMYTWTEWISSNKFYSRNYSIYQKRIFLCHL